MNLTNTTKVGILAIAAIGIFIWGYSFLAGQDFLGDSTKIFAEYDNVDGLAPSDPVVTNGFKIGTVSKVYLKEDYSGKLMVELDLTEKIPIIRKGAVARIVSTSIMGGKGIELVFQPGACEGGNCLSSGDTIPGKLVSMFGAVTEQLDPYINKAEATIASVDSMIKKVTAENSGAGAGFKTSVNDVQEILRNLNSTSRSLKTLIANSSGKIDGMLGNFNDISGNLKGSNADITKTMRNAAEFTDQLKQMELAKTLASANAAIASLSTTMSSIDKTVVDLNLVIGKINDGKGTLGQLVNNEDLYKNLDSSMLHLGWLLQDFRLNPRRYTAIMKKNRGEYKTPTEDPALKKEK